MKNEERVAAMEKRLCDARRVIADANASLERLSAELDEINKLDRYYGSKEWYDDIAAYDRGEVSIPCGVLSEDEAYDVITARRELAVRMLELATEILRK